MNVYDYIYSPDIREHCKKINHNFSQLEQAAIIFNSERHSLLEKQQAYRALLEECAEKEALFAHLERLINEIDETYRFIKRPLAAGKVYGFVRPYCFSNGHVLFSSLDRAANYALENLKPGHEIFFELAVFGENEPDVCGKSFYFSPSGVLYEASGFGENSEGEKYEWPENAYIGYPLPFEKGDIVEIESHDRLGRVKRKEAVFESLCARAPEARHDCSPLARCYAPYIHACGAPTVGLTRTFIDVHNADHVRFSTRDASEVPSVLDAASYLLRHLKTDFNCDLFGILLDLERFYTNGEYYSNGKGLCCSAYDE